MAVVLVLGLANQPARADVEALENLTADWYAIEVIVFQRTAVNAANSPERLIRTEERRMPANVQSLAFGTDRNARDLDAATRATLEFPVLRLHCDAMNTGVAEQRTTSPAWYQPPVPDTGPEARFAETEANGQDESGARQTFTAPNLWTTGPCAPATAGAASTIAVSTDECPPIALDIPLPPSTGMAVCGRTPGRAPPAIRPRLAPHPLLDWLRAARRFEDQLRQGSYQASRADAGLNSEADRIRKSDGLELLWHGRWTAPVPNHNRPRPVLIQGGPRIANGYELEGFFAMTRSGLLQFQAKLWLARTSHPLPAAKADVLVGTSQPWRYMLLDERRTMRREKLHYLDHPKLGILVRADPVSAPDWLVDALGASGLFEPAQRSD